MAKNAHVYREPLAWSRGEWSPQLIKSARMAASSGHLALAAQLVDTMLADDRVQSTLSKRVNGLLAEPMTFNAIDDSRRALKVAKNLEDDFFEMIPEGQLYQLASWGLMLGVGLAEVIWDKNAKPSLKIWHPQHLRYDHNTEQWLIRTYDSEIVYEPNSPKWLMHLPYGRQRPWSSGLWQAIAMPWLLKCDAMHAWGRDNEVGALRVGSAGEGAGVDDREQFARDLSELGRDTGIVLPAGYELDIIAPPDSVYQSKRAAIEWANKSITIAIAGQNLTTDVGSGSLAAAKVHELVGRNLLRADSESLSTTLRNQLLVHYCQYHYGDGNLAPWPSWQYEPPEDKVALADSMVRFSAAVTGLQALGLDVDVDALAQRFEIPLLASERKGSVKVASRLASARSADEGQGYADRLFAGQPPPDLDFFYSLIDGADNFEALKASLLEQLPNLNIAEQLERALILAELAGRHDVLGEL